MIKNKRIKKNWSEEDVKILIWVVSKYSDFRNIDNIGKELVLNFLFLGFCRLGFHSFADTWSSR